MARKFQVPRTFTVPDTIEGVVGLLTARGWEKAAIVYAYTQPSKGGRPASDENRGEIPTVFPCSMREFARLGITGLREVHEVKFYRDQWVKGIEEGWADIVGPGDTIDVPDPKLHPFPVVGHDKKPTKAEQEAAEEFGVSALQVARVAHQPKLIQAAITASEKAANAAWEILAEETDEADLDDYSAVPETGKKAAPEITPEKIRDAIKSNPKVSDAAWEALQEQQVEYANNAALEAIQRGGKVTPAEPKPKAEWPEVMEEVERAEPIHDLRRLVEEVHAKADLILANGDPQGREAEYLAPVVKEIGEVYWALSKLVIEAEGAEK